MKTPKIDFSLEGMTEAMRNAKRLTTEEVKAAAERHARRRGSSEAVLNALRQRVSVQHIDWIAKYGLTAVTRALEDFASGFENEKLEEIGTSDVSCWLKDIEKSLAHHADKGAAPKQTKSDALIVLHVEAAYDGRLSRTAYQRITRALRTLEVSDAEANPLLVRLGYHDEKTGALLPDFAPKPKPIGYRLVFTYWRQRGSRVKAHPEGIDLAEHARRLDIKIDDPFKKRTDAERTAERLRIRRDQNQMSAECNVESVFENDNEQPQPRKT